ncbi:MAG TPA: pentapeptide repeat-containing protein [Phormidium sp.]
MNTTENKQKSQEELQELIDNPAERRDFSYQDMRGLQLAHTTELGAVDLEGSDLSYANLSEMDLTNIDLCRCNLTGTNLSGACLEEAYLNQANLTNANLEGCDLSDSHLYKVNFTSANLKNVNFDGAEISEACIWTEADLTGAYYGFLFNEKIMMERPPTINNYSFPFEVMLLDKFIKIGCQLHSYKFWLEFSKERAERVAGDKGIRMLEENREAIIKMANLHGCSKD